jgi:hypothetical protein
MEKEKDEGVIGRGTKGYKDGQLGHTVQAIEERGAIQFFVLRPGGIFFFFSLYSVSYKMRRLRRDQESQEEKRFLFLFFFITARQRL